MVAPSFFKRPSLDTRWTGSSTERRGGEDHEDPPGVLLGLLEVLLGLLEVLLAVLEVVLVLLEGLKELKTVQKHRPEGGGGLASQNCPLSKEIERRPLRKNKTIFSNKDQLFYFLLALNSQKEASEKLIVRKKRPNGRLLRV